MSGFMRPSSWLRWLTYGAAVVVSAGSLACEDNLQLLAMIFNTSGLGSEIPGRRADLKVKFVNQTAYRPVFTVGTYDPLNTGRGNPVSVDSDHDGVPDIYDNCPSAANASQTDRDRDMLGAACDENDEEINVADQAVQPIDIFPMRFVQFVVDTTHGGIRLDAFSESEVITWRAMTPFDPGGCGRAIGLGGEQLIQLIEEDPTSLDGALPEALRPLCNEVTNKPMAGIAFFRETSAGPAENACDTSDEIAAWAPAQTILQGDPAINVTGDVRYPCDGGTVIITFVEDSSQEGGVRIDVSIEPPAAEGEAG